jgi:Xaa-Pro aminopeptidase
MTAPMPATAPVVPAHLLKDGHPAFSATETARRRTAVLEVAARQGLDRVLLVGVDRSGSAVPWVTGWPVTREAWAVVEAGRRDSLFVGFYNHVPQARELAGGCDVGWVGPSALDTLRDELDRRGHGRTRLGVIGPLPARTDRGLARAGVEAVDLNPDYVRLRQHKSAEELEWLRVGAALSDAAIAALHDGLRSGLSEWELADLVERAYVPYGGTTHIHYFGVTPMHAPRRANPTQHPSGNRVAAGDAVTVELSAAFGGYAGQVLRTFAVEADPPALYRDLHDVAEAALDAVLGVLRDGTTPEQVQEAASVIEDAGFTTLDDLVHGFGGGYLPPVLGSRSRDHDPGRAQPFTAGMTVVVQPNVVTPDGRAGVQCGELVHVTTDGVERLHRAPRGLLRVG